MAFWTILLAASLLLYYVTRSNQVGQTNPSRFGPYRVNLFSGVFPIEPKGYRYRVFVIEKSDVRPHVIGRFSATGVDENIQVVVAEKDECDGWLVGRDARLLFKTDETKEGAIDVPIKAPGAYCLALSNRHSLVSARTVAADIELDYLVPATR